MSKLLVRVGLLLPLVLSGCMVRSLSPIYTDKDLISMPAVEGTWKGEDEGETLSFVRKDEGYLFTYVDDGDLPVTALAHFATIGKKTYMDVTIAESIFDRGSEEEIKELERLIAPFIYYTTPVHMFYQIDVRDKVLRMRTMDHAWVNERREKGRLWIDHIAQEDSTLLTADTVRVQRFIRRWANNDDAWGEWNEIPLVLADTPAPAK